MNNVFCFGELLLRLSPAANGKWIETAVMPVYIGGAELNVATALSKWNMPVSYCTALPDNQISHEIISAIKKNKIDTSSILLMGNRIGTYYLPLGADMKNSAVIYDRDGSSFSKLGPGMIDWKKILKNCSWFHFSAISPALNDGIARVCEEALKVAADMGLTISVDLNYRSKLWKYGRSPLDIMPALVKYSDIVMGNIWSAEELLGIHIDKGSIQQDKKEAYLSQADLSAKEILRTYSGCKIVANTFRFSKNEGVHYYATLNTTEENYVSPDFNTDKIMDKVGSGDCFMAGLIHGVLNKKPYQDVINFAAAAAFGKLQEKGDATDQTIERVNSLAAQYGQKKIYN